MAFVAEIGPIVYNMDHSPMSGPRFPRVLVDLAPDAVEKDLEDENTSEIIRYCRMNGIEIPEDQERRDPRSSSGWTWMR